VKKMLQPWSLGPNGFPIFTDLKPMQSLPILDTLQKIKFFAG
jgi:hypothetical protein